MLMNRINQSESNLTIKETTKRKRGTNFIIDLVVLLVIIEITFRLEVYVEPVEIIRVIRMFILLGGYYFLMEYFLGKTVGKMITRTQVVNSDGAKISIRQTFTRTLWRYAPFAPIIPLLGVDAKVWHDVRSKTYVVDDDSMVSGAILDGALAKR